ncbi:hypothetical protein J3A83DRAFT_4254123 [Scleroderma citrinum]
MKETAHSEPENGAKKAQCSSDTDDLFHRSRKRSLEDLLHPQNDNSGFVEGRVFMVWPPVHGVCRLNLEVAANQRFEVVISTRGREALSFRPHDRICLALKGAKIVSRKESSAPNLLPLILKYTGGLAIKYLSGANAGKVIDTSEELTPNEDWFDPGSVRRVSDIMMEDVAQTKMPILPSSSRENGSTIGTQQNAQTSHTSNQIFHEVRAPEVGGHRTNRSVAPRPTKTKKRKRKRQAREIRASGALYEDNLTVATTPRISQESNNVQMALASSGPVIVASIQPSDPAIDSTLSTTPCDSASTQPLDSSRQISQGKASLSLEAGFRTEMGDIFTALNSLQKGQAMVNVVGLVTQAYAPKRTSTNEWTRSFTIVDPSIDSDHGLSTGGIGVICFQKKYVEWLPQLKNGDIVILRRLKMTEFNGVLKAIGYSDKLRWAVYDHATNNIQPYNGGGVPEGETMDNGVGYYFTPFWKPDVDGAELKYCKQLFTWQEGLQGTGRDVIRIQCAVRPQKEHRLLSEVSPDVAPQGFFNCTVEVLQTFSHDCGSRTVYVTDYTCNPHVYSIKPTWCSPALYDCIFPIEMWDKARDMAQLMDAGEYWYLYNVQARWGRSGYMEGKMWTPEKITQVDEAKSDSYPHLKVLLARKKKFLEGGGPDFRSSNFFPYKLFQDVDKESGFFSCAVAVLFIDCDYHSDVSVYATDYTFNPNLPERVSTAEWARGLDHRILRIKLDDAQAKRVQEIHVGDFHRILNLRFIQRGDNTTSHGRLGGDERLILPLTDQDPDQCSTLKANKEKWKRELMLDGISLVNAPSSESIEARSEPIARMPQPLPHTQDSTIQQVLSSPTCPSKFTVVARVVDFFPFLLEEASVLRCMKCESTPPVTHKACPKCDNMVETHCKWCYCLYFRLRDDTDHHIDISLCEKECALLQSVEPDDFHYNQTCTTLGLRIETRRL